jgi:CopG antitoxin of type II toxin-antitoxin system
MSKKLKPIPHFHSEAEEREFWESHDSTEYVDWSNAQRARLPNLKLSPPVSAPAKGRGSD